MNQLLIINVNRSTFEYEPAIQANCRKCNTSRTFLLLLVFWSDGHTVLMTAQLKESIFSNRVIFSVWAQLCLQWWYSESELKQPGDFGHVNAFIQGLPLMESNQRDPAILMVPSSLIIETSDLKSSLITSSTNTGVRWTRRRLSLYIFSQQEYCHLERFTADGFLQRKIICMRRDRLSRSPVLRFVCNPGKN